MSLTPKVLSPVSINPAKINALKLHAEDIQCALENLLHPKDCKTLETKQHELYEINKNLLELKTMYSIISENTRKKHTAAMIVKTLPITSEDQRLFQRELTYYRYLEPQLREILVQTVRSPVAKCLLARGDSEMPKHNNPSMPFHKGPPHPGCDLKGEMPLIILDDLRSKGFVNVGICKCMTYQQCMGPLEALAKFHAAYAVLDRCDPKLKRTSFLTTAFPFLKPDRGMFAENEKLFDQGMKVIGIIGPHINPKELLPGKNITKIINFMHRNLHSLLTTILEAHKTQLNTLCHTNCHDADSFLFLTDQKERNVFCKITGLGQVRYCRPAVDLSLLLYCAADHDVRKSKIPILLEYYRDNFNKILESCQKKYHSALKFSSGLLGRDQLIESIKETKLLGVTLRALKTANEYASYNEKELIKEYRKNDRFRQEIIIAIRELLLAVEPYAGDCNLYTDHLRCPHHK